MAGEMHGSYNTETTLISHGKILHKCFVLLITVLRMQINL